MPFGPLDLERYFARLIEPHSTYAFSGDEPIVLRLEYRENDTVKVYRDDTSTLVYENTFTSEGVADIELGTAQDVLYDNNLHELIVEYNGLVKARIPAIWYPSTQQYTAISFQDENGLELVGHIRAFDANNRVIKSYYGSSIQAPTCDQCYVEFLAVTPEGKKYYTIIKTSDLGSGSFIVKLYPKQKYHVTATFKVDPLDPKLYGPMEPVVSKLNAVGASIADLTVKVMFNSPLWVARRISSMLGIDLPIVNARVYEENGEVYIEITWEVDPPQLIVAAIAIAIVLLSVGAVVYLVDLKVREAYEYAASVAEWASQAQKTVQTALNHCKEICGGDEQCYKDCIQHALPMVQKVTGITSNVIEQANNEINRATSESEKWKYAALALGGVSLVAILSKGR